MQWTKHIWVAKTQMVHDKNGNRYIWRPRQDNPKPMSTHASTNRATSRARKSPKPTKWHSKWVCKDHIITNADGSRSMWKPKQAQQTRQEVSGTKRHNESSNKRKLASDGYPKPLHQKFKSKWYTLVPKLHKHLCPRTHWILYLKKSGHIHMVAKIQLLACVNRSQNRQLHFDFGRWSYRYYYLGLHHSCYHHLRCPNKNQRKIGNLMAKTVEQSAQHPPLAQHSVNHAFFLSMIGPLTRPCIAQCLHLCIALSNAWRSDLKQEGGRTTRKWEQREERGHWRVKMCSQTPIMCED